MNLTRDRLRSIGWVSLLTLCTATTAGLTLRVNAVKSEVHRSERGIVAMRREITFLETEYQTRSNQQQLKALNDVEFGYMAPRAGQYIEGERQLAALGMPREPSAPPPIRVAMADTGDGPAYVQPLMSPVNGVAQGGDTARPASDTPAPVAAQADGAQAGGALPDLDPIGAAINAESLSERLARIEPGAALPE